MSLASSTLCFTYQYPLYFGDGSTSNFEIQSLAVDTSGNLAFGGLGYLSASSNKVPLVGYINGTLNRVVWAF
jgi:hypothetical protein